jgi:hypothetical protein
MKDLLAGRKGLYGGRKTTRREASSVPIYTGNQGRRLEITRRHPNLACGHSVSIGLVPQRTVDRLSSQDAEMQIRLRFELGDRGLCT